MTHQRGFIHDTIRAQPVARLQRDPLTICKYVTAGKRIGAGEAVALDFFTAKTVRRVCAKYPD